jgi:hypothetical protein
MTSTTKLLVAAAALASITIFEIAVSRAGGSAPWCAVVEIGGGEMYWDCRYRTVEECAPNVIAGNRGFCNLNPYGPAPGASAVEPARRQTRHVRQAAYTRH